MIVVAAACVAVPLWRARARAHLSTDTANRAIYAARTEELQADVAAGRLSQADYAAALHDLDRELAATLDTSQQEHDKAARTHGSRLTAGIVAALVVVAAGISYWQLGNWRAGVEGVRQASVVSVENKVAQLAHRLRTTDPDDLQGWEMLGHAYMLMSRYQDAVVAYSHARTLSSDGNAEVLAGYGEAVALANPADFMSKAMPAFEKALQLNPHNPQALWYGGLGALEGGNKRLAVTRWNALLAQNPPAEYRKIIEKAITAAGGTVNPSDKVSVDPAGAASPEDIRIDVTLDPRLRGKVAPDETLFVFAEPAGQHSGPPLVVRRFRVSDLPLKVILGDADSMLAGRKLSDFNKLEVIARISKSGTPTPQAGDLTGQGGWQAGVATPVHIQISTVLP